MPPHILVAEDQADIRDLLVMNLRGAGYDVAAVADGAAALASQSEQRSDLLILDLMMPALDGLEVCKALRARGHGTPILMLTAKSTELDRVLGGGLAPMIATALLAQGGGEPRYVVMYLLGLAAIALVSVAMMRGDAHSAKA